MVHLLPKATQGPGTVILRYSVYTEETEGISAAGPLWCQSLALWPLSVPGHAHSAHPTLHPSFPGSSTHPTRPFTTHPVIPPTPAFCRCVYIQRHPAWFLPWGRLTPQG